MKRIFVFLLCCFAVAMSSSAQGPSNRDSIPVILHPIDPIGTGDPIFHAPLHAPSAYLYGHTLYIYTYAEKQVSVYPVDYDDQTAPLYSTVVPESTYSTLLPSWLSGAYAIEIVLNGHTFVGEIEL